MNASIFDRDKVVSFRLPWPQICALACRAVIERVDLETLVVNALEDRVRAYGAIGKA